MHMIKQDQSKVHNMDLLWRYYEKNRNFGKAAHVLARLADMHRFERITTESNGSFWLTVFVKHIVEKYIYFLITNSLCTTNAPKTLHTFCDLFFKWLKKKGCVVFLSDRTALRSH